MTYFFVFAVRQLVCWVFGIPGGDCCWYWMMIRETPGSEISLWFPLYPALPGHFVMTELVPDTHALRLDPL